MLKWLKNIIFNVQVKKITLSLIKFALVITLVITIKVTMSIKTEINNIKTDINSFKTDINNVIKAYGDNNLQLSTVGDNNKISVFTLDSDKLDSDKYNTFFDANLINLYKFQSLWDTNIGFYDGGSRNSYSSLLNMEKSDSPTIKKLASDAIKTVKNSYDGSNINVMVLNIEGWNYICKWSAPKSCTEGFEPSIGYNVKNVFDHLSYGKWQERARAACLLRNMDDPTNTHKEEVTKKMIRDKLVNLMGEQEPSLFVSKMAFETYKTLTPEFSSPGVFDFEEAIKDCEQRKINIQ